MSVATILFYFFVGMGATGALGILFSKNVFKSALFLLVTLLSVAAIYALTYAEFLAVTQILIYAGGIAVIILFGVMLTTRMTGRPLVVRNTHILSGTLAALSLFVLLLSNLPALPITTQSVKAEEISSIALAIFSGYALTFELAGILLLIALIGAAVVSSNLKSDT